MTSISPDESQIRELVTRIDDGPVVMVNLLKFRRRATGTTEAGAEAYARYAKVVAGLIEDLGGRTVWRGQADQIPAQYRRVNKVDSPVFAEVADRTGIGEVMQPTPRRITRLLDDTRPLAVG